MTIVELLVAMVIALLLTLGMVGTLTWSESQKRTTSAMSDVDQSSAFAASSLDTYIRNAGSGLLQSPALLGCTLPELGKSLPAPFADFSSLNSLGLSPVLIASLPAATTSDPLAPPPSNAIVLMAGSGAAGGVPRTIRGIAGTTLTVNTVGISTASASSVLQVVLLDGQGGTNCALEPVTELTDTTLTVASLAGTPQALLPLGNPNAGDLSFLVLGVDPQTQSLMSFDLLSGSTALTTAFPGAFNTQVQPIVSNVIGMYALYGLADANGSGKLSQWVLPQDGASGSFALPSMLQTKTNLNQIVALRIALIFKGSLYEKDPIPSPPLQWFLPDLAGTQQDKSVPQSWTPVDLHYRYRVQELVIPLRNTLIGLNPKL